MSQHLKKTTIPIQGMHCRSCEILISDELLAIEGVEKVKVNYHTGEAEVLYTSHLNHDEVNAAVRSAGYKVGKDEKKLWFSRNSLDYLQIVAVAIFVWVLYLILSDSGILNLSMSTSGDYGSLPVVFLVGLTAGLSTCMALVGGLVLGASARFAEKHSEATSAQKFIPHLFFNLGRIISFFVLGAVIGIIGSFFQLSPTILGLLTIVVGITMLLLGLQLTELFPRLSSFNVSLPTGISRMLGITQKHEQEYNHKNAMIMGALTFFLPCGFTQAIQLYAISTGDPIAGALTMGVFALGTTPGLIGIGGLTSIIKGSIAQYFFKFVSIVVIALALFNISNGFNLAGLQTFTNKTTNVAAGNDPNVTIENGVQIVRMDQELFGYSPNSFVIQKDIPVKWVINSKESRSCAASIFMQKYNIQQILNQGENVIEFTPDSVGTIPFSCSMGMYTGSFTVVEKTQ